MHDPLFGPLRRQLAQEAVKYAAGRAIFCPSCRQVLDAPNTVLVTGQHKAGVACGPCFDQQLAQAGTTAEDLIDRGIDIDDGRKVFPVPQHAGQGVLL